MGGALIDLMRGRYGPSGVSSAWALAASPTEAERFSREVSLRWERAAAELEELIRARMPAPEHERMALTVETAPPGRAAATLDRNLMPRVRRADPPRTDPVRRIPFSADRQNPGGRRIALEPSRILAEGPEAWIDPHGELADALSRRGPGERVPEPEIEPGAPCPGESHPSMPHEGRRRPESEAWAPSRGSRAAAPGEASWRRAGSSPRDGADDDRLIPVPREPLEEPRLPSRGADAFSPGAGASFRAAGPAFHGFDENPRPLLRDGGPTAPAAASGRSPRRGASPGPPLELLVEEARRQAEALEDWERTGF